MHRQPVEESSFQDDLKSEVRVLHQKNVSRGSWHRMWVGSGEKWTYFHLTIRGASQLELEDEAWNL